ncbi:MAG: glycosyltransferase family 2 protein [Acidobacteriaceae bacterium]
MTLLVILAVCFALLPCALFLANLRYFAEPPQASGVDSLPKISVLIPARNEELSIAAAMDSVLASTGVDLELIVLDDASTDRTAEIVTARAATDARLRLATAPRLPAGWNGKQHACHVLSGLAQHDLFCFLDADVRLAPAALSRMIAFLHETDSSLVSGFPEQETRTFLEWLLLPLIHFILLGFLPLAIARKQPYSPGLAAGCGQFLLARRDAYRASGGHAAIRATMHDGLLLPQRFRASGLRTAFADLSHLATCRMYRNATQVWQGLSKNATEGMAAPARIVPFTAMLAFGQVLPLPLLALWALHPSLFTLPFSGALLAIAVIAGYLPRMIAAARYRQSWRGALLHPLGIAVLLVLQWTALTRKLLGVQATWKQRAYNVG